MQALKTRHLLISISGPFLSCMYDNLAFLKTRGLNESHGFHLSDLPLLTLAAFSRATQKPPPKFISGEVTDTADLEQQRKWQDLMRPTLRRIKMKTPHTDKALRLTHRFCSHSDKSGPAYDKKASHTATVNSEECSIYTVSANNTSSSVLRLAPLHGYYSIPSLL